MNEVQTARFDKFIRLYDSSTNSYDVREFLVETFKTFPEVFSPTEVKKTIEESAEMEKVYEYIRNREIINAIKVYRLFNNVTLKEAKDAVEALRDDMGVGYWDYDANGYRRFSYYSESI